MSHSKALFTLFCFSVLTVFLTAGSAHALEKLNYSKTISKSVVTRISQHLDIPAKTLNIAEADLNQDGIPELFVKTKTCKTTGNICPHFILAQRPDNLITLDTIKAYDVAIGNEYASGVRNLLVFKNVLNDFDYDVYTWIAKEKRFAHRQ